LQLSNDVGAEPSGGSGDDYFAIILLHGMSLWRSRKLPQR
jgi:hypothetical protein